jgi:hypothetical protein
MVVILQAEVLVVRPTVAVLGDVDVVRLVEPQGDIDVLEQDPPPGLLRRMHPPRDRRFDAGLVRGADGIRGRSNR